MLLSVLVCLCLCVCVCDNHKSEQRATETNKMHQRRIGFCFSLCALFCVFLCPALAAITVLLYSYVSSCLCIVFVLVTVTVSCVALSQIYTHTLCHSHKFSITCACCYDEIKGAQDRKIYSLPILCPSWCDDQSLVSQLVAQSTSCPASHQTGSSSRGQLQANQAPAQALRLIQ